MTRSSAAGIGGASPHSAARVVQLMYRAVSSRLRAAARTARLLPGVRLRVVTVRSLPRVVSLVSSMTPARSRR